MRRLKCSICEGPIEVQLSGWANGNNAEPVNSGRCCDLCDSAVVIPMRIERMMANRLKPMLVVSNDEE